MTSASEAKGKDAADNNNGTTTCCRLCLSLDPKAKTSVIVDAIGDPQLPKKIYEFVNVKIIAGDKHSTMVCTPCIDKINMWYDYKETCLNNQLKLEKGLHNSETSKEIIELTDSNDHDSVAANGEVPVTVKNETIEVEYEELPPSLTPQDQHNDEMEIDEEKPAASNLNNWAHNREEDRTANSQRPNESTMPCLEIISMGDQPKRQYSRERKILPTENLQLVAKNVPVELPGSLTNLEKSYIEKCIAMSKMHTTLRCACHNVSYSDLKSLFTHVRNSPLGFPVFTCYNCMITFADRSSKARHSLSKCPRRKLEALIKLSNLRQRSDIKVRIYQNYKCSECNYLYSFHEDFCTHIDESHNRSFSEPFRCSCQRVFTSFEEYRSHAYISCLIEYHCDICLVSVKTLDDFEKHAADCHDSSEGFPILQDDNYKQRGPRSKPYRSSSVRKKTHSKEATSVNNIVQGKRLRRASAYLQLRETEEYTDHKDAQEMSGPSPMFQSTPKTKAARGRKKTVESSVVSDNTVINPASAQKNAKNICNVCGKKCSNSYNLLRHLGSHKKKTLVNETNPAGSPGSLENEENSKKTHLFHTQPIESKQHRKTETNEKMHELHPELEQHKNVPLMSFGNKPSIVMCEICDTMFLTKNELTEHKLIHEIMPVLEPSIDIDKKDQKLVKYYDCKLCDKSYLSNSSLWKHSKRYHPEYQPTTYCDLCDKEFYKSRSYNRHKLVHQKDNDSVSPPGRLDQKPDDTGAGYNSVFRPRPSPPKCTLPSLTPNETDVKSPFIYTCDVCVGMFSSKADLIKHKKKHAQERTVADQKQNWVPCEFCKMSFLTSDELDDHVKQKHDVLNEPGSPSKQFGCTQCPKVFANRFALSSHGRSHKRSVDVEKIEEPKVKKIKLTIAKPVAPAFKCSKCKVMMPNDIALQIHILEKHGNVDAAALPARCCTCNLDFPNHEEYEHHKRLHNLYQKSSVQKNFSCTECSAAFTRSDDLDIHRRQFHTKEEQEVREFKCPLCNRVFDKQNFLDIHLKVHQKQKLMVSQPKQLSTTC